MTHHGRRDANHAPIVKALRGCGWTVWDTADCGKGAPDIVVGAAGINIALEIKDGDKSPSRRKLTPAESKWHAKWQGQVHVVETVAEAIEVVTGVIARTGSMIARTIEGRAP